MALVRRKERTDGYDLIEWIARKPWCNGNVGMIGDSYWSWSQYSAAAAQPPHLKCICLCDGGTDLYRDACYPGGIFNAQFMNHWIAYHTAQLAWPGEVEGKEPPMNLHYEIVTHPYDGPFWRQRSPDSRLDRIKVPMLSIAPQGGPLHFRGQLDGYAKINAPKKLMVVPPTGFWSHMRYLTNKPLNRRMLRWFDHWLKGIDTGLMGEPEVAIFDRATQAWRYENEYPLKRTQWTKYYLRTGDARKNYTGRGGAGPLSDAGLLRATHRQQAGGCLSDGGVREAALPLGASQLHAVGLIEPDRHALVRQSARRAAEGPRRALEPRHAAGLVPRDRRNAFQARPALASVHAQQPLEPNKVYEFQIELRPVFHTFKAGHRLQLTIASEDIQFNNPLRQIDVQLLPWPVENSVHHNARHPSHLLLPVLDERTEQQPVAAPVAEIDWPLVPGQWMANTDGHPLRD